MKVKIIYLEFKHILLINFSQERMRRSLGQNNGHTGGTNEFHLDVPSMPIWPTSPMHVQLISTNLNGHPTGIDHLINTSADPLDRKMIIFIFPQIFSPRRICVYA